ncbi:WG repeat-containing protein [Dysgonomonas sp. 25]|uniref:WG repeat-containing protein n=1 Tax=Dysgonomonas sp. 25 TaxID=2302933 RepID=UPI0013D385B5|nr:WG repeat-containing protein [Dysgonomonas sp. 25]NDV70316.1 hypothetical protein [Dysgonomonas sp. 25]
MAYNKDSGNYNKGDANTPPPIPRKKSFSFSYIVIPIIMIALIVLGAVYYKEAKEFVLDIISPKASSSSNTEKPERKGPVKKGGTTRTDTPNTPEEPEGYIPALDSDSDSEQESETIEYPVPATPATPTAKAEPTPPNKPQQAQPEVATARKAESPEDLLRKIDKYEIETFYENDKQGYRYKNNGKIIIPAEYDYLKRPSVDRPFIIARKNGKYGIIDIMNKVIAPFEYDEIQRPPEVTNYETTYCRLKKGTMYGIINARTGKIIVPVEFIKIVAKEAKDGTTSYLNLTKDNKKWGLYSIAAQKQLLPIMYEERINVYSENLFSVKHNGLYGAVNANNEEVIPIKYKDSSMGWLNSKDRTLKFRVSTDEVDVYDYEGNLLRKENK